MSDRAPQNTFEMFKDFVSKILTVTKEDIQKVEETATDIVRKREPAWDEDDVTG